MPQQQRMCSFISLPTPVVAKIERKVRQAYQLAGEEPNQRVVLTVHFIVDSDDKCNTDGNYKIGGIKAGDRVWTSLGKIVDGQLEIPGMGILSDEDPEESESESEQPAQPLQYAVSGRR